MGSTRLPGKVLMDLGGRTVLAFLLERLERAPLDSLIVATSDLTSDDPVADEARAHGAAVARGPESDVLSRFLVALGQAPGDNVVRITADCPFADPAVIAAALERHRERSAAYTSNTLIRTFPDGLDVEVVAAAALERAGSASTDPIEREHVTPFIYRHPEVFPLASLRSGVALGDRRWTLDTADDLALLRRVVAALDGNSDFGWREALEVAPYDEARPASGIHLRPVLPADEDFLLRLRNDPVAVTFSPTGRVSATQHAAWFANTWDNPGRRIWICEVDGRPAGQTRVDVVAGVGEMSLALLPEFRGRGLGVAAIRGLLAILRGDAQVTLLIARIHPDNVPSIAAFTSAGFTRSPDGDTLLHFCRPVP